MARANALNLSGYLLQHIEEQQNNGNNKNFILTYKDINKILNGFHCSSAENEVIDPRTINKVIKNLVKAGHLIPDENNAFAKKDSEKYISCKNIAKSKSNPYSKALSLLKRLAKLNKKIHTRK